MAHNDFEEMLELVAKAYNSTPSEISEKISLALAEGQQSPDTQVRTLWSSIPHTGSELTLQDFVAYLAATLQQPFEL